MNAALALDPFDALRQPPPALVLAPELEALFEESAKMRASFGRLPERDRRGFLRYIEEAKTAMTRERRAAIVAMSLLGLARDLGDDGSVVTNS